MISTSEAAVREAVELGFQRRHDPFGIAEVAVIPAAAAGDHRHQFLVEMVPDPERGDGDPPFRHVSRPLPQIAAAGHAHVGQSVRKEKDAVQGSPALPGLRLPEPFLQPAGEEGRPARIQRGDDPVELFTVPPHGTRRPWDLDLLAVGHDGKEIVRPHHVHEMMGGRLDEVELACFGHRAAPVDDEREVQPGSVGPDRRDVRGDDLDLDRSFPGTGNEHRPVLRPDVEREVRRRCVRRPEHQSRQCNRQHADPSADPFRFHEDPPFRTR